MTNDLFKYYAIIVAGGTGTRMQSEIPKQFLLLSGKPVLMHTIQAFYHCAVKPHIIVVLPKDLDTYWNKLCADHNFTVPHQLINGGETRFHSVKNALDTIIDNTNAVIAVQDAVRPLTSRYIIENSYQYAIGNGNAVTAVKSRDSVRRLIGESSISLPREEIYLVQTPQTFRIEQIKKAYLQPYDVHFTDDASVVEAAGYPIHLAEGSHQNIKITFPGDIAIAEGLMKESQ